MNLLPFVVIFIFVLTLGIQFSFTSYQRVALEQLGMEGLLCVYREERNQREKKNFAKEQAELAAVNKPPATKPYRSSKETPPREHPPREEKEYRSHRLQMTENSKFCIDLLLQEHHPRMEEVLERLLEILYAKLPLVQQEKKRDERFLAHFVQEMLRQLRKMPKEGRRFTAVRFSDSKWQLIWYKMQKGSFDHQKGWAPLTDYLLLGAIKDRKPVSFRKCAFPVLEAFFGVEMAHKIVEKEKQKYVAGAPQAALSTQELASLLGGTLAAERGYLSYHNYPVTSYMQEVVDDKSGVYIRALLPLGKDKEEELSLGKEEAKLGAPGEL